MLLFQLLGDFATRVILGAAHGFSLVQCSVTHTLRFPFAS
jgi:hypothetical protein